MRWLALLIPICLFAAACNMSAPGVARVGAPLQAGEPANTTYNSDWVTREEGNAVNAMDHNRPLSIDLSKREMGVRYTMDESARIGEGKRYEGPSHEARQRERREARKAIWRERTGLKTMRDEEEERKAQR